MEKRGIEKLGSKSSAAIITGLAAAVLMTGCGTETTSAGPESTQPGATASAVPTNETSTSATHEPSTSSESTQPTASSLPSMGGEYTTPNQPGATSETTTSAAPTQESTTPPTQPGPEYDRWLSEVGLREMTPEERLVATRISKEKLDDPVELAKEIVRIENIILNAGSNLEDYQDYVDQFGKATIPYAQYICDNYYYPLYEQLYEDYDKIGAWNWAVRASITTELKYYDGGRLAEIGTPAIDYRIDMRLVSAEQTTTGVQATVTLGDNIDELTAKQVRQALGYNLDVVEPIESTGIYSMPYWSESEQTVKLRNIS